MRSEATSAKSLPKTPKYSLQPQSMLIIGRETWPHAQHATKPAPQLCHVLNSNMNAKDHRVSYRVKTMHVLHRLTHTTVQEWTSPAAGAAGAAAERHQRPPPPPEYNQRRPKTRNTCGCSERMCTPAVDGAGICISGHCIFGQCMAQQLCCCHDKAR